MHTHINQPNSVILAHSLPDFRCSHVPPTPEQVHHVWLDDTQFDTTLTRSAPSKVDPIKQDFSDKLDTGPRSRRHIDIAKRNNERYIGFQADFSGSPNINHVRDSRDSPRNFDRYLDQSMAATQTELGADSGRALGELVPMKIQVHYDSSVYSLEKRTRKNSNG